MATDDEEIAACVRGFGGAVELTRADHETGTDRVAEVAERHPDADVVVNVQGDQPFATAAMLEALVAPYRRRRAAGDDDARLPAGRRARRRPTRTSSRSCATVGGDALYFSRSPIPHARDGGPVPALHHLGLYAFTRETLLALPRPSSRPRSSARSASSSCARSSTASRSACALTDRTVLEINTPEDLDAGAAAAGRQRMSRCADRAGRRGRCRRARCC